MLIISLVLLLNAIERNIATNNFVELGQVTSERDWNNTFAALSDLYQNTGGSTSWINSSGWTNDEFSVCDWHGVTCSAIETNPRKIMILDLKNNNLTGTIPETIGLLKPLRSLRLSNNSITGTLPESVGNLANLELLSLYNNTLTGTLPQTMGNMSSLKWVGLWSNNFTGSIPYTFQNLTNLETLYLDRNQFNSIENATFSTTNLIKIVLSNNNITGDISDSMCEMAKNKTLKCDFSGNNFTCPFRCEEFKRVCKAKCVKLDEGPKERKKKKKPDPNEDLRLMPQIQRVAEVEGCLNQSRFSELMLYYVNQNLDEKALESLFKAFDFDKGGNITADELEGF